MASSQHIKVVGSSGQIIKSTTVGAGVAGQSGNMTGIAALAAAAAATSKITSSVTGTTSNALSTIGELYKSFVHKRALVKYQSQNR